MQLNIYILIYSGLSKQYIKKYFQKITKKERFYLTVKYNRIYYM